MLGVPAEMKVDLAVDAAIVVTCDLDVFQSIERLVNGCDKWGIAVLFDVNLAAATLQIES